MTSALKVGLAFLLSTISTYAAACGVSSAKLNFWEFTKAEIVVRAKISAIKTVSIEGRDRRMYDSALVTFETIEEVFPWQPGRKTWTAYWDHVMLTRPEPSRLSTNVIVGFRSRIQPDGEIAIEAIQQVCGPSLVLPDTRENLDQVLEAVGLRPEQRERILEKRVSPEE
jgi:hypothetical protein